VFGFCAFLQNFAKSDYPLWSYSQTAADLKTTMTDDSSNVHGKQTSLNTRCRRLQYRQGYWI